MRFSIIYLAFILSFLFTGRIALKLVERKSSIVYKTCIIAGVYMAILWTVQPLQSIAEAHRIGRKVGQQTGDVFHTTLNWHLSILAHYLAGGSLDKVQTNTEDFITTLLSRNEKALIWGEILLYHQTRVLKEGKCALDKTPPNKILTEADVQQKLNSPLLQSQNKIHQLVRAYLFRQLDDVCLDIHISDDIERSKHQLRPSK